MLNIIYQIVVYGIVPAILLATFLFGIYVTNKVDQQYRLSARAGLFAGLVAFAIYVVSSFSSLQAPSISTLTLPSFYPIPVAIGAVMGFALLQLAQLAKKMTAGLVGLFVLFLVGTSSIAIFSYFFASPLRSFAIYFTLSTLFGMLVDVMLFPTAIRTILKT